MPSKSLRHGSRIRSSLPTRRSMLLGLSAAAFGAEKAAAQRWNPFQDQNGGVPQRYDAYDREFVRQWEAQPPRGFPTLAAANIEATKAAIRRYTDIVARGGFPQVAPQQLQAGSNGQAVAVLRERLTLSGDLR